jgi:hypothetical protein
MIHPARAATTAARGPRPPRRRGRLPAHRPRGPPARRHAPLWEDHITWTRLAIVSFAGSLPDLSAIQARLLRNQSDVAAAIRPDYGRSAERRLRTLLREHITGAVTLLGAAKGGGTPPPSAAPRRRGTRTRDRRLPQRREPRHWPRGEMRAMMKTHLDLTLKEAVDRLNGRFDADVLDYEAVHRSILEMADMLRDGIVAQSPERFR